MNAETGIVNIRGKQYHTVAKRVDDFRAKHPEYGLTTEIVHRDSECVVVRANIINTDARIVATGHSEEYRKSSQINKTSALENCETSAIGRALAAFGFGGTEFASANEVQNAIHQQGQHSQGDDQGAVSAPAPPEKQMFDVHYDFPDGPATGITQLKAMVRSLWREAAGCGDYEELLGLTETTENKAIMEQCDGLKNPHHREIWEGDGKDNPGLKAFLQKRLTELAREKAELINAG